MIAVDPRWRRAWRVAGVVGLIAIPVVCLLPLPDFGIEVKNRDKIEHVVGYFFAMWWWAQLAQDRRRVLAQAVGFVLYGIAIEVMQSFVPWRSGNDPWDVLANTVGVAAAVWAGLRFRVFDEMRP